MTQYSGSFTLQQQAQALTSGQWCTDPYFKNTTLLLHADGVLNGSQNNTFLDSSSNAFAITRNGNTTQGTFSPYGNLWSNYFDGVSDYLSIADNAAFDLGTGDFTIEAWVYHTTTSGALQVYYSHQTNGLALYRNASGYLEAAQDGVAALVTSSTVVPSNQWVHVAASRSGTSLKLFINGVQDGSATNSTSLSSSNSVYIGSEASSTYEFTGYLSNLRLVKGTALYTSSFTPSTTPLTAVSGTSLLTCQSNRFIDNSTNAFALTVNGTPSVQSFQPFMKPYQYSASVIGGSGYFDGSGDWLSGTNNSVLPVGSQPYTIELWFYQTSSAYADLTAWGTQTTNQYNGLTIYPDGRVYNFWWFNDLATPVGSVTYNAWTHLVAQYNGTTRSIYINGVLRASDTPTAPNVASGTSFFVGGSGNSMNGYISGVRISNAALYSGSTYAVPTTPLTAITNTSLLCNFTNAGIYDSAMMNDLETVGNAQVSTNVVKYGSGSMYFDGTGDYLSIPNSPQLDYGSGNFTIEFWVYFNATANQPILFKRSNVLADAYASVLISTNGSSKMAYEFANSAGNGWAAQIIGTTTMSTGQWYHVAVVRNGTAATCYVNGATDASTTLSSSIFNNSQTMTVGYDKYSGGYFNGYIDDLRITKGVARYTANFQPPQVAFANQ